MRKTPIVSLIGRPNVGKSSLFNRLLRKNHTAITYNTPGVTRDRHYEHCHLSDDHSMVLVDTGGFIPQKNLIDEDAFIPLMADQARIAIEESDLVLFVLDVREGISPFDHGILDFLRKSDREYWILVNKYDHDGLANDIYQFAELGIDPESLIKVSAEHSVGLETLREKLQNFIEEFSGLNEIFEDETVSTSEDVEDLESSTNSENSTNEEVIGVEVISEEEIGNEVISQEAQNHTDNIKKEVFGRVAIVGAPNAGKSTLLNRLLREKRALVSDIPGTTRDAIRGFINVNDSNEEPRVLEIVDTAGIRRKGQVRDQLEIYSVYSALRSINESDVVLYLIDGTKGITHQDKRLIGIAWEKGKSVVIGINKNDQFIELVKDTKKYREMLEDILYELPWMGGLELTSFSALRGHSVRKLMKMVVETLERRFKKLPTAELNEYLRGVFEHNEIMVSGYRGSKNLLKLKYASQVKNDPPTFLLFVNRSKGIPRDYRRYVTNSIKNAFDYYNTPVHLVFRKDGDKPKEDSR